MFNILDFIHPIPKFIKEVYKWTPRINASKISVMEIEISTRTARDIIPKLAKNQCCQNFIHLEIKISTRTLARYIIHKSLWMFANEYWKPSLRILQKFPTPWTESPKDVYRWPLRNNVVKISLTWKSKSQQELLLNT